MNVLKTCKILSLMLLCLRYTYKLCEERIKGINKWEMV